MRAISQQEREAMKKSLIRTIGVAFALSACQTAPTVTSVSQTTPSTPKVPKKTVEEQLKSKENEFKTYI
jgi:uncharacterized lipoprotein YajG